MRAHTVMLEIERLLGRVLGLNVSSIGRELVHRAIHLRVAQSGANSLERYQLQLEEDPDELQALIEDLVVSETWFFRNHEALERMVELFTTEWSVPTRGSVRRVLSVPCATGEEPYSIAIALAEAGLARDDVAIDAIDISRRALSYAERGVYRPNSFRSESSRVCERYMRPVVGGSELAPEIRQWVRFAYGNLVSDTFLPPSSSYDVIFCRNVLIYLERAAQEQVLKKLYDLTRPSGYLFVGPAEMSLAAECGFRVIPPTTAFVCQKEAHPMEHPRIVSRPHTAPVAVPAVIHAAPRIAKHGARAGGKNQPPGGPAPRPQVAPASVPTAVAVPPAEPENVLAAAQRLADSGRLTEAADLCSVYLRDHGPVAEAFYLLGLVQDARGVAGQAVMYYRKALFLDPHHEHASAQLAIHAQRSGDTEAAQRLRGRAQRAEQRRHL